MKKAVYEMRRDGWRSYFELHIHKTAKSMRAAMRKDPLFGGEVTSDMLGCVCPVQVIDMALGKRDQLFAYMHLNEEDLGVGVVAHECLHVAFAHERMTMFECSYGADCGKDEERIAYLLTDIIRGVYDVLNKNGHIKPRRKL